MKRCKKQFRTCTFAAVVAKKIAILRGDNSFSVEHPTGEFTVQLESHFKDGKLIIEKSGVMRTARLLSKGEVFVPQTVWVK